MKTLDHHRSWSSRNGLTAAGPTALYTSALLYMIAAYAVYAIWMLSFADSTMSRILNIIDGSNPLLPDTTEPLRRHFTGLVPVDYWLSIMVLFFWEAVDGSHPATSIVGVYFLGQLLAVWTLVWIVGSRTSGIRKTILWTLLMQNLTLGCFGPVWLALHLDESYFSPLVPLSSLSRTSKAIRYLRYLPISMMLGYIVPSIAIGIPAPGPVSYASQQLAIAFWTPFPVWAGLVQVTLSWMDDRIYSPPSGTSDDSGKCPEAYKRALRVAYLFAIIGSAAIHIGIVVISLSNRLFPALFAESARSELDLSKLLGYPGNTAATSIGEGVLNFMKKDQWLGYGALWIWLVQLKHTRRACQLQSWAGWVLSWLQIILVVTVLGPGSAAAMCFWARDEMLLAHQK